MGFGKHTWEHTFPSHLPRPLVINPMSSGKTNQKHQKTIYIYNAKHLQIADATQDNAAL